MALHCQHLAHIIIKYNISKTVFVKSYLHTVTFLGPIVVWWNSFLVKSSVFGIAIGLHELNKKDTPEGYSSPEEYLIGSII